MKDIHLETRLHIVKAGWLAIKIVLDNEIPATPAETAFLMETLSDVAAMVDDGVDKKATLDVNHEKGVAIWHCCNVVIMNDLYYNKNDKMHMMEIMSLLAPKLDGELESENDIEDLQECTDGTGRLQLVDGTGSVLESSGDSPDSN